MTDPKPQHTGAQTGGALWLVFRDEGLSLHSLMYAPVGDPARTRDAGAAVKGGYGGGAGAGAPAILQPSEWWWQLRQGARVRAGVSGRVRECSGLMRGP